MTEGGGYSMTVRYQAKGNFVFDDINLSSYNAFAFYCNVLTPAVRDVEMVSVPGRNGDILFDNGRYKNVDRVYRVKVNGYSNIKALLSALSAKIGYYRLEDTYETDYYFKARLNTSRVVIFDGDEASLEIVFDRIPQKYPKSSGVLVTAQEIDREYPLGNPPSRAPVDNTENPVILYRAKITNNTKNTFYPLISADVEHVSYRGIARVAFWRSDTGKSVVYPDDLWNNDEAIKIVGNEVAAFTFDCETGNATVASGGSFSVIGGTSGVPKILPGDNYLHFIKYVK